MEHGSKVYHTYDFVGSVWSFFRRCVYSIISIGPIPNHIAFIMDGNRRYAKCHGMKPNAGHRMGFLALMSVLQYCYEMGVHYVTVYAFSIDNFNRTPEEVQHVMDLMQDKIEGLLKEESFVNKYGIRVNFWGNLRLLRESVRLAAEKAMAATAENKGAVLSICIAYTSRDEIVHAIQGACKEKYDQNRSSKDVKEDEISVADLESHMYTSGCPDPDIIVRTSGETRLSNFLLWQSSRSYLHVHNALWPEISFCHLMWEILQYQRVQPFLEKQKEKSL
ncbi:Dehydrodolichyl diphosphate synthase 6 [Acorus calamus]|uniref:Alkyl transferase n=1 Tax=Acorus calamus TaxID=4465 RepID=A0AAV9EJL9_ACOCL|nr:Dehydrodolichyl diphosphate synthase 6 [Acorus calamus]